MMRWQPVIGIEIHAQLKTRSKLFSGAATRYGAAPNAQACGIDVALPGTLPVLNVAVVRMAVAFGLSINGEINLRSVFERKNYFYPDLPKGYQISQFHLPIVSGGSVTIASERIRERKIGITRAHLEEDAGKSLHEEFSTSSGIDLNRAGTPLIEIVSEPEIFSVDEAVCYMKKIHGIVTGLDICDGNMQEGSFRCDVNVSLRARDHSELGTRTEIKNLNSFRFAAKAIDYEIARQSGILESGREVTQETRLFDTVKNQTRPMRDKEEANDYRYFPDPDLAPVVIDTQFVERVREELPELPDARRERFVSAYSLSQDDALRLTVDKSTADYFELCVEHTTATPKSVANWVNGELMAALKRDDIAISDSPVTACSLAKLIDRVEDKTISGKMAKEIFELVWTEQEDVDVIIAARGLSQITDTDEIEAIVRRVIDSSARQVAQYRSGKQKVFGYFVGQVMKLTESRADPKVVNRVLKRELDR